MEAFNDYDHNMYSFIVGTLGSYLYDPIPGHNEDFSGAQKDDDFEEAYGMQYHLQTRFNIHTMLEVSIDNNKKKINYQVYNVDNG